MNSLKKISPHNTYYKKKTLTLKWKNMTDILIKWSVLILPIKKQIKITWYLIECNTKKKQSHHLSDIPAKDILEKPKLKNSLQNSLLVNLKNVNVMKVKERLKNCPRLKETNETWQQNATCDSGLGSFATFIGTARKISMGSMN